MEVIVNDYGQPESSLGIIWINDDDDTETTTTGSADNKITTINEVDTVPALAPDFSKHMIVSQRNLEDFARLWVYVGGLQAALTSGNIQVGLKWQSTNGTTPAINIYLSADPNGSDSYLSDSTGTAAQAQIAGVFNNAITDVNGKQTVDTNGTFILPASSWSTLTQASPILHLIFEGAFVGTGQLAIVFLDKNGNQIGQGPGVWMDLRNIKTMYMRGYSVAQNTNIPYSYTGTVDGPNVILGSDPNAAQGFVQPSDETPQVIIFVHGFNINYDESTNYAETMFKRLWWRGYKGRFAAFRWPTYGAHGGYIGALTYNDSEYIAWNSGAALKAFVAGMPSNYALDFVAHSAGNMVVGEALREGMSAKHYALLHAATSASCYSSGSFNYTVTNTGVVTADTSSDPTTRSLAYTGWLGAINANNLIATNFFDNQDSVVGFDWNANNLVFKPQRYNGSLPSMVGLGNTGYAYDNILSLGNRLVVEYLLSPNRLVSDPAEAKAYADFSLTGTIGIGNNGAKETFGGAIFNSVDDSSAFGDEHSSEWNRNIQVLTPFYDNLMLDFGLVPNS
jgi:Alpha/beta hydrolase of unknown function (DUF900)